jgi:predicted nucleic acid-binding protein
MRNYIFDTTVLSNFASTGRLDLLDTRYSRVAFTTVEVTGELRRGVKAGYSYLEHVLQQIEAVDSEGWLRILVPKSGA